MIKILNSTNTKFYETSKIRERAPCKVSQREELILYTLANGEEYGLGIANAIKEASFGLEEIRIGTLYPSLTKLEKKGLITSRWGDEAPSERCGARRRYYQLTKKGLYTLEYIIAFKENLLAGKKG